MGVVHCATDSDFALQSNAKGAQLPNSGIGIEQLIIYHPQLHRPIDALYQSFETKSHSN